MKRIATLTLLLVLLPLFAKAEDYDWKAQWITVGEVPTRPNMWMGFHKEADIAKVPESLFARIGADSRYWLWINGTLVVREGGLKRGPNRRDSYYDEVQIAPYLHEGRNDIAVLLWYFGREGFSHNSSGKPAILFDAQSKDLNILSDTSW